MHFTFVTITFFQLITIFYPSNDRGITEEVEINILVNNVDNNNPGKIIVAVYEEKYFLKKIFKRVVLDSNHKSVEFKLILPKGKYCVSVFHDTNQNDVLDRNFIGIPKEPIAFSRDYRPFGPPKFKGCSVTIDKNMSLELNLEKVL
jgi:uncharacterized protein (DUF2141 family)